MRRADCYQNRQALTDGDFRFWQRTVGSTALNSTGPVENGKFLALCQSPAAEFSSPAIREAAFGLSNIKVQTEPTDA